MWVSPPQMGNGGTVVPLQRQRPGGSSVLGVSCLRTYQGIVGRPRQGPAWGPTPARGRTEARTGGVAVEVSLQGRTGGEGLSEGADGTPDARLRSLSRNTALLSGLRVSTHRRGGLRGLEKGDRTRGQRCCLMASFLWLRSYVYGSSRCHTLGQKTNLKIRRSVKVTEKLTHSAPAPRELSPTHWYTGPSRFWSLGRRDGQRPGLRSPLELFSTLLFTPKRSVLSSGLRLLSSRKRQDRAPRPGAP